MKCPKSKKVCFNKKSDAKAAARRYGLHVYFCRHCPHWHLTKLATIGGKLHEC